MRDVSNATQRLSAFVLRQHTTTFFATLYSKQSTKNETKEELVIITHFIRNVQHVLRIAAHTMSACCWRCLENYVRNFCLFISIGGDVCVCVCGWPWRWRGCETMATLSAVPSATMIFYIFIKTFTISQMRARLTFSLWFRYIYSRSRSRCLQYLHIVASSCNRTVCANKIKWDNINMNGESSVRWSFRLRPSVTRRCLWSWFVVVVGLLNIAVGLQSFRYAAAK